MRVDAMVAFPPKDTVRFSLPATTHRCTNGRALLLEAVSPEGSGLLMRLQFGESLATATYHIVGPADTTVSGAMVAVRYLLRDIGHSFYFDSGSVQVRRAGGTIAGRIQGSGIENAIRTPTRIDFHDVSLPAESDTLSCAYQP